MKELFSFNDYKDYLNAICLSERGMLTRLSEAAKCQKSYLSLCLKGKAQITLDHACGISEYLNLSSNEEEYFFLLVEKAKASSARLSKKLDGKIKEMSREAYRLKNQQSATVIVAHEKYDLSDYYDSWIPAAVHSLSSVDSLNSFAQMTKRLGLPNEVVQRYLDSLLKHDLIKKVGNQYRWNSSNLHLADGSTWLNWHHINWRHRAVDNIQKKDMDALHYSVVQTFSIQDFEVLKRKVAHFIKDFNKISDPSTPEEAFALNIDLFKV